MDPEAVRRSLEPTASAEEITGSTPARLHFYDPFVLSGVSLESAEHGRLLCSFVVTPRHASTAGYLRSGVTATLADQLGSAVLLCSGLPTSGVSLEISTSFVDVAAVGDFDKGALEKFIEVSGFPTVVTFDADPTNHKFLERYYSTPSAKAMLFLNFSDDRVEAFKNQIQEAAKQFSANNISFLIGDVEAADRAFQYFGLKENDVPLLFVIAQSGKYLNPTIDPDQVMPWLKQYIYGNLKPYIKSEPIPKVNDQPVKVVVADSIDDVVFNSGKNVLLEFYAPWCGHCRKMAPILEEVAVSMQEDEDVVIAKMDGTANDVPTDFAVDGYPTIYFYSTTGDLYSYNGGRTAEDIISFIKKHKGPKAGAVEEVAQAGAGAVEEGITASSPSELLKDEL